MNLHFCGCTGIPSYHLTSKNTLFLHSVFSSPDGVKNAKHVLIGEQHLGSQFHFAMEALAARVIPTEDGYDVFCTSQWPKETQATVAQVLEVPAHRCGSKAVANITPFSSEYKVY